MLIPDSWLIKLPTTASRVAGAMGLPIFGQQYPVTRLFPNERGQLQHHPAIVAHQNGLALHQILRPCRTADKSMAD
jgi:hypothetical protein